MRDLLVFAIVMLSMPTIFQRPFYGMLVFSWLAYMRPQDLCWGFARTMRLSFLVAAAMLLGWYANERGRKPFAVWHDYRSKLMILLGLFVAISYAFAKYQTKYTNTYFFEFNKIIVIALFTSGQVDSVKRFKVMVWTIAICLGFFGIKGGLFGFLTGGGTQIIRGPGGMLEDNNDFALALTMNVPLLWYLGIAERDKPIIGKLCKVGILLTVVTILLTHSRGAFLALTATSLWIAWRSGKIFRAFSVLALLAALFPFLAPQAVLDRLATIGEGSQESSINARFKAWRTAFNMIEDRPILGVGMRNFRPRYEDYAAHEIVEGGKTYVAHNSYLQIWAESGTLAFGVYLLLLGSVFFACRRVYRIGMSRPDLRWAADYARMMEATTAGFMVGAFFLNRGHFDLVYHWFALVAALLAVTNAAFREDPALSMTRVRREPGAGGGVITSRWRSAVDRVSDVGASIARATPTWQRRT